MSVYQKPRSLRLLNAIVEASARAADLTYTPVPSVDGLKLMKSVEVDAILAASTDPASQANHLRRVRQVTALLKKNPHIAGSTEEEREKASLEKFFRMQDLNAIAQKRLNYYFSHPSRMAPLINNVISMAAMDVFRLLGPEPGAEDWERFDSAKVFSRGVTQGLPLYAKGVKDVDAYAKVLPTAVVTGSRCCMSVFGERLINGAYREHLLSARKAGVLKVVESDTSYLSLQPKDATIDRVVFAEPSLNAMAQQGLRAILEPYLWSWGVTLENQKRNQQLARVASMRGFASDGFATIDLTSASDTVLTVLVKRLMPPGWFRVLDAARTHSISIAGTSYETAMFSSMGNAVTFAVECLIFAAITRACIKLCSCPDPRYRVYGDDIICPIPASALLLEALKFCGFHVNVEKSYFTGSFRESCGADYLNGVDVRPVFLKGDVSLPTERYSLFNRIQSVDPGHPVLPTLYGTFENPLVGPAIGPNGGETGHFVAPVFYLRRHASVLVSWDPHVQAYRYTFMSLTPRSRKRYRDHEVCRLLAGLAGSPGERHDLRRTQRYSVRPCVTTTPFVAAPVAPLWYM